MTSLSVRVLFIGGAAALTLLSTLPAAAQVPCPAGFYYSYGYGCVPISDGYDAMYGDGYNYGAPVYDTYGMAFGFGGGGAHRGGGRSVGGGMRGGGSRAGGGGHAGGGRR